MRRAFFRLMLGDLNIILDGLTELEDRGVETLDCRRAQFSAQEPIVRLRMICQSWKVMFQAEYSSGSPLRMLVDLRASVEHALGKGKSEEAKAKPAATNKPAAPKAAAAAASAKTAIGAKPGVAKAAAAAGATPKTAAKPGATSVSKSDTPAVNPAEAPEFEVSSAPGWDSDAGSQKKN
jgi:hypothetical protein